MVASNRMVRGLSHLSLFHNAHRRRSTASAPLASRRRGVPPALLLMALGLCAALGGCAGGTGGMQSVYSTDFWVEPGKYEFLKCPDLARQSVDLSNSEKRLMSQMERASQDVGGALVNAGVYQVQLNQTRANLELVQRTAHEKGCTSMVPPANR
jgi:hypothetical protein